MPPTGPSRLARIVTWHGARAWAPGRGRVTISDTDASTSLESRLLDLPRPSRHRTPTVGARASRGGACPASTPAPATRGRRAQTVTYHSGGTERSVHLGDRSPHSRPSLHATGAEPPLLTRSRELLRRAPRRARAAGGAT